MRRRSVRLQYLNTQGQPRYTWPASFVLARAYLDQLARSRGLAPERVTAVRTQLESAERASGGARNSALAKLASSLERDAARSADGTKVKLLARTVLEIGSATP